MKKNLLAAILLAAAACGSDAPAPQSPSTSDRPHAEIGAWGFDLAGEDPSVSPGADFYKFANGTWDKNTPIPADKSNYGMFTVLADKSDERTKEIILNASKDPSPEARKVADFYGAFMDEAGIEARGLAPVQGELDRIAAIKDRHDLAVALAYDARRLRTSPVSVIVAQDDRDPDAYIPTIGQGGLGLPDRDMYDTANPQFEAVRQGYKHYIEALLGQAGIKDAAAKAAGIYALEEKIAAAHWTRVENRDPVKTYNKMSTADLATQAPGLDWKEWLGDVGLDRATAVNVNQPTAVAGIAKLVGSEPVDVWKDYLTFQLLSEAAPYLPKAYVDLRFEMYGKTLSGVPQLKERWKRGVDQVTGALGEAVGKLYVTRYFTPETKAHADELVGNLLASMGHRLDNVTWMSPETKAKARAKLATYNPKIGFPKKWRDYSALVVKADDPFGNADRAAAFEYDRRLVRLGQPVDRDEWGMTPMTVNAYYNPGLNEIVFPAAILQPPFFDPGADDAVNYGAIGAVIGHEISHGFDDQGSQYDERGRLANWWTPDDLAKFKVATSRLAAQYSSYCPFPATADKPAQCVKGELTLGENIADLAGLTVAYDAYKLALGGKTAPVIDGLTGDQRFFLGWAQIWRRLYRNEELAQRLVTDPHSPSEFRAAVVRNLDVWYDAFKVQPGDALYLPPDQRVHLW
ncbi:MAG TPA: M13 family metallopeptidase [Kofleriaceae bacterium]|nr:M13 family metallopeptidase [Kofleriaceae bacterium]